MKSKKSQPVGASALTYLFVILAFLSNVVAIVFGYFNSTNTGGLFNNTMKNLSVKYYTEVTPAPIIFAIIWPIIFLWTLSGSFYLVVSLCLPSNQSPVNISPTLTPTIYYLLYSLGFGSATTWFFAFDRELLAYSFGFLAFSAASFYGTLYISLALVNKYLAKLEANCKTMLWVVRVLIQNGLGLITTWLTLATAIGFTTTLLYIDSPGQTTAIERGLFSIDDGSALVLGIVLALMLLWFVLENFYWQNYLAYLFTDYPVFITAFAGLVAKLSENETDRSMIMACVNVGVASVLFLARIGISIYRFVNHPSVKNSSAKQKLIKKDKKLKR